MDLGNQNTVGVAYYISCRDVRPPFSKGCPGYDTKLHLMVRLQFWRFGECGVPLNCLYFPVHSGLE